MIKTFISILILLAFLACRNEQKPPQQMVERQRALTILEYNQLLVERTAKMMEEYVDSSKITFSETGTGLYLSPLLNSSSVKPSIESEVEVNYTATILQNGHSFTKTERGIVKVLKIKGIREAVQKMVEGEQIQLLIPPHLAFGIRGDGDKIVPAAVLIVELQLVKIY